MAPTPTVLKIARGNPGKRAIRPEPQPNIPATLPPPPDFLNQIAQIEWKRAGQALLDLRLFTEVDYAVLGAYCEAYARWVNAQCALEEMALVDHLGGALLIDGASGSGKRPANKVKNPLVAVISEAANDMVRFGAKLGFSPSDRTKIATNIGQQPPGKFSGLLAG